MNTTPNNSSSPDSNDFTDDDLGESMEELLLKRDPTGRLLAAYERLPKQLEYLAVIEMPDRAEAAPVFATSDEQALTTFDSMLMLWHNNRRLYPTSIFEHHVYPDAIRLSLFSENYERELVSYDLAERQAR